MGVFQGRKLWELCEDRFAWYPERVTGCGTCRHVAVYGTTSNPRFHRLAFQASYLSRTCVASGVKRYPSMGGIRGSTAVVEAEFGDIDG
jgi:hypothetical protein